MITADDVTSWANLTLSKDDDLVSMERVVSGVLAYANRHYTIPDDLDAEGEHADLWLGLVMQAARLYGRRTTPDGIASFGEQFSLRVSRFDPDIETMCSGYWKFPIA